MIFSHMYIMYFDHRHFTFQAIGICPGTFAPIDRQNSLTLPVMHFPHSSLEFLLPFLLLRSGQKGSHLHSTPLPSTEVRKEVLESQPPTHPPAVLRLGKKKGNSDLPPTPTVTSTFHLPSISFHPNARICPSPRIKSKLSVSE